jgi:hypothetical protein
LLQYAYITAYRTAGVSIHTGVLFETRAYAEDNFYELVGRGEEAYIHFLLTVVRTVVTSDAVTYQTYFLLHDTKT